MQNIGLIVCQVETVPEMHGWNQHSESAYQILIRLLALFRIWSCIRRAGLLVVDRGRSSPGRAFSRWNSLPIALLWMLKKQKKQYIVNGECHASDSTHSEFRHETLNWCTWSRGYIIHDVMSYSPCRASNNITQNCLQTCGLSTLWTREIHLDKILYASTYK